MSEPNDIPTPLTDAELNSIHEELHHDEKEVEGYKEMVASNLETVNRLKRGEFTKEKFQNLCHNRHDKEGCTAKDFFDRCAAYQAALFGASDRDRSRLDGLRYALGVVKGRRILNRPPAYLAAVDEMEIFLEAAIDRVERGEQMSAFAVAQTKTPPE